MKPLNPNLILITLGGSQAYGVANEDSDRDELGVYLESFSDLCGFTELETIEYSFPEAKLEKVFHPLKKFLRLAIKGNPTINAVLYAPVLYITPVGEGLRSLAPLLLSQDTLKAYLGYMESQRQRLLGERGQKRVKRPELEAKFGFDTKYAYHIIRLGYEAVALGERGRIEIPLGEGTDRLRQIRGGMVSLEEVVSEAQQLEQDIKSLLGRGDLPPHADSEKIETWLLETYRKEWNLQ